MNIEQQDRPPEDERLARLRLQAPLFHPTPPTEDELKILAKAGEGGSY